MRKALLILVILILLSVTIEIPDVNVTGINVTGLLIGVASGFMDIMRMVLKQILLSIAEML